MKKLLISLVVSLVLIQPAFAMIVSDPTSYVYEVEQIANQVKEYELALDSFKQVSISADKLTAMKKQLEGTYNRIAGLGDRLQAKAERLAEIPGAFQRDGEYILDDLTKNGGHLPDTHSMSEWKKLDIALDSYICDRRDPNCKFWKNADKQYETRQNILKTSLKRSTIALGGLKGRMEQLDKLFQEVGKGTQRDEINLTNRLIAELLTGQQEVIALLAQIAQANAIVNFKGSSQANAGGGGESRAARAGVSQSRYEELKRQHESIDSSDEAILKLFK